MLQFVQTTSSPFDLELRLVTLPLEIWHQALIIAHQKVLARANNDGRKPLGLKVF